MTVPIEQERDTVAPAEGELFLAGERVPAGVYRQIETAREIVLDHEDFLPASLDGRVACYEVTCVHLAPPKSDAGREEKR